MFTAAASDGAALSTPQAILPCCCGAAIAADMTASGVEGLRLSGWVLVAGMWEARAFMQAPGSWAPPWTGPIDWRHHVRARIGGHHRPCAVTGRDAWSLGGVRATEQGAALPGRSADGRGDHPRDARGWVRPVCGRIRGLIAILWLRAGLRISEALALTESDLDPKTGSVLVRAGKGGKRRIVGMDDWAWEHVRRWTEHRVQLPIGPLFCVLLGRPAVGVVSDRRPRGASPARGPGRGATAVCAAPLCRRLGYADASKSRLLSRGFRGDGGRHNPTPCGCLFLLTRLESSCGRNASPRGQALSDRSPESGATHGRPGCSARRALQMGSKLLAPILFGNVHPRRPVNAANYADLSDRQIHSCSNSPGMVGITIRSA